jgi:hypothetical protein
MHRARRVIRALWSWLIAIGMALAVAGASGAQTAAPAAPPSAPPASHESARQKDLEREAAVNLSLAKKSIQEDAYYNARVALNVWRASALEAGTFDPRVYDELKKQLYDKSVKDNLRCIDTAIAQRDAPEANLCLRIYRLHATEIGVFDPRRYEELRTRIGAIRRK